MAARVASSDRHCRFLRERLRRIAAFFESALETPALRHHLYAAGPIPSTDSQAFLLELARILCESEVPWKNSNPDSAAPTIDVRTLRGAPRWTSETPLLKELASYPSVSLLPVPAPPPPTDDELRRPPPGARQAAGSSGLSFPLRSDIARARARLPPPPPPTPLTPFHANYALLAAWQYAVRYYAGPQELISQVEEEALTAARKRPFWPYLFHPSRCQIPPAYFPTPSEAASSTAVFVPRQGTRRVPDSTENLVAVCVPEAVACSKLVDLLKLPSTQRERVWLTRLLTLRNLISTLHQLIDLSDEPPDPVAPVGSQDIFRKSLFSFLLWSADSGGLLDLPGPEFHPLPNRTWLLHDIGKPILGC